MANKAAEIKKNRIVGISVISVIALIIAAIIIFGSIVSSNGFITKDGSLSENMGSSRSTAKVTDNFKNKYNELAYSLISNYRSYEDNVSFSINDILNDTAFMAACAGGETRMEIEKVLGDDYDSFGKSLNTVYKNVSCDSDDDAGLMNGSTCWLNNARLYNIKKPFLKENGSIFGLSIIRDSFKKEFFTDKIISKSSNITGGYTFATAKLTDLQNLAIVSSASFKGKWKEQASKKIYNGLFSGSYGSVDCKYFKTIEQKYIDEPEFCGIQKEFDCDCTLVALLPKHDGDYFYGISDIISKISENGGIAATLDKFYDCPVAVTLPYYVSSVNNPTTVDLKESIKRFGIEKVFDSSADMSSMIGDSKNSLCIDSVLAAGDIAFSPDGACNGLLSDKKLNEKKFKSCRKAVEFSRSFLYLIIDNETKLPVYFGILNNIV